MQATPRVQHLVGHRERVGEGGLLIGDPEQVLVRNDQQGVDHLVELGDAVLGGAHAALAFEVERLGHHADGEDPHLAGSLGDHRRSARAGAAAHAGGDENHVRAGERIAKPVHHLLRGRCTDNGLRTGAEALGDLGTHLDDALRFRHRQRLRVGVGDDEVDALQPGGDHVVDGITTRAADAEDGDPRFQLADVRGCQIECHGCLSRLCARWFVPAAGRGSW
nr:hypothetical protein [Pantoea stewartii]